MMASYNKLKIIIRVYNKICHIFNAINTKTILKFVNQYNIALLR